MNLYGFRGFFEDWINDYINGRKQVVKVGNQLSGKLSIKEGILQVSTLGCLFFTL